MCSQHLNQSRLDVDRSIALFRLYRNLFAIPDAPAYVDSSSGKAYVFDMQRERFPTSQPCTRQGSEQHLPLTLSGINDLKHFIRAEASLLFERNLRQRELPFAPYLFP